MFFVSTKTSKNKVTGSNFTTKHHSHVPQDRELTDLLHRYHENNKDPEDAIFRLENRRALDAAEKAAKPAKVAYRKAIIQAFRDERFLIKQLTTKNLSKAQIDDYEGKLRQIYLDFPYVSKNKSPYKKK